VVGRRAPRSSRSLHGVQPAALHGRNVGAHLSLHLVYLPFHGVKTVLKKAVHLLVVGPLFALLVSRGLGSTVRQAVSVLVEGKQERKEEGKPERKEEGQQERDHT
jgi:hypothetical protein